MKIFRKFKQIVRRYLLFRGVFISKITPKHDLVSFLASLKPVKTNRELIRLGGDSDGGYLIPDDLWAVPGFKDTLLRCLMEPEVLDGAT